jgi:2-hydroxyglutarate dehydrogenase
LHFDISVGHSPAYCKIIKYTIKLRAYEGLFYKSDSFKTAFCIRGREQLYSYCSARQIPHRNVGKLVVAQRHQLDNLGAMYRHVEALRIAATANPRIGFAADMVPSTCLLSGDEARELEPDLSDDIAGALLSPATGIVDSHALMQSFEYDIIDGNGSIAYSTRVVRVDPHSNGFVVQLQTGGPGESTDAVVTHTLINASGLSANLIWNSLRLDAPISMYFARGSYASYSKKVGAERFVRLICCDVSLS